MRSHSNPQAAATAQFDCPGCGEPMEIIDRFTLYGVPAPVEHVKVRCVVGHWYTVPTDWLAPPDRDPQYPAAPHELAGKHHRHSVTQASHA